MASISVASNNAPFLLRQERLSFSVKNSKSSLGKCGFTSPSCSSLCFAGFSHSQKYHQRLNRQTHLRRGDISRFSLRLKPRHGLLPVKLRRTSSVVVIVSILDGIGPFIRKNMRKIIIPASVSLALGLSFLFLKLTAIPSPKAVPYSDLVSNLQHGIVSNVLFEEGTRRIYFNSDSSDAETPQTEVDTELVKPPPRRASKWQYSTRKIDHDESYLLSLMREKGTMYSSAPQSLLMSLRSVLMTVLYLWIPLTPLMWLLYRQLSSANSPAKKRRPTTHTVSFDDVEGVDSAKVELMEIVSCLQGDINYYKLGAKLPRGVLLVGPPGTGKTLLARAVAGESGVPFFSVSASEFVELFVGRGAARIRDLFSVARKNSPSIIFIDELDAVGGKRGRSFNDERDQTLNQLLTEMDGFNSDMKVVVIAATNRPEALDAALCRPGRFSRKVFVGEPDEDGRRKILGVHLRGVPLDEDSDLICSLVASLTQGFAGADLANIVNEAALLAARRGAERVSREDIMEAIERAKYGVNGKEARQSSLSKEVGKLFPWMPLLNGWGNSRQDGFQGAPIGYQTLS